MTSNRVMGCDVDDATEQKRGSGVIQLEMERRNPASGLVKEESWFIRNLRRIRNLFLYANEIESGRINVGHADNRTWSDSCVMNQAPNCGRSAPSYGICSIVPNYPLLEIFSFVSLLKFNRFFAFPVLFFFFFPSDFQKWANI